MFISGSICPARHNPTVPDLDTRLSEPREPKRTLFSYDQQNQ